MDVFLNYDGCTERDVRGVFARYDGDGDGRLRATELKALLRDVGLVTPFDTDEDEAFLRRQFAAADRDGDGAVAYEEFAVYLRSVAAPRPGGKRAGVVTARAATRPFARAAETKARGPDLARGKVISFLTDRALDARVAADEAPETRGRGALTRHGFASKIPTPPPFRGKAERSAPGPKTGAEPRAPRAPHVPPDPDTSGRRGATGSSDGDANHARSPIDARSPSPATPAAPGSARRDAAGNLVRADRRAPASTPRTPLRDDASSEAADPPLEEESLSRLHPPARSFAPNAHAGVAASPAPRANRTPHAGSATAPPGDWSPRRLAEENRILRERLRALEAEAEAARRRVEGGGGGEGERTAGRSSDPPSPEPSSDRSFELAERARASAACSSPSPTRVAAATEEELEEMFADTAWSPVFKPPPRNKAAAGEAGRERGRGREASGATETRLAAEKKGREERPSEATVATAHDAAEPPRVASRARSGRGRSTASSVLLAAAAAAIGVAVVGGAANDPSALASFGASFGASFERLEASFERFGRRWFPSSRVDLAPFPAETPKPPVEGEAEAPAAPAMNVILPPPTRDAKTIRTFWY